MVDIEQLNNIDIKDVMLEEYKKCISSPLYFIMKYVYIQTGGGRNLFSLFEFQKKLLHILHTKDRLIILKSRQLGITTLCSAYALWSMLFKQDYISLALAPDQEKSKEIIYKITFSYNNLPNWLIKMSKAEFVEKNKFSLTLKNGSRAIAASGASKSARGKTADLLILDEVAFIERADELFASAQQTLSHGGTAILLSCVTKDTYVYTNKGIKKIENFINNSSKTIDYVIPKYDILGKDKIRKGELFHNNGFVKTKFINSTYSYIEGSYNHKLYVYKEDEKIYRWAELEELNIGDYICIQYGMNIWGNNNDISSFLPSTSNKIKNIYSPKQIDNNISYFIGLYLSEGSSYLKFNKNNRLVGGNITITCGDDISKFIESCGLKYSSHDKLHYSISSKNLIEFFEYLGFDLSKLAKQKIIPERVLEMSKNNIIHMLKGIFDGDGSVMIKDGSLRVCIGLSSKEFILQIRILLLNLGITSTYQEVITKITKKVKVHSNSYRLDISGNSAEDFCNIVGFNLDRKKLIYEDYFRNKKQKRDSGVYDIIPNIAPVLNKIQKNSKLSSGKLYEISKVSLSKYLLKKENYLRKTKKCENISRVNALKIQKTLSDYFDDEIKKFYDNNISEHIIWSKITNIEDRENFTYDFSLPETEEEWCHSIIYNGIVGHQTPNGVGNFFHNTWIKAEMGETDFIPIRLPWDIHPNRDERWRKKQDEELGERLAKQECDCSYLTSGDGYFDTQDIEFYKESCMPPIKMHGPKNDIWVFEEPDFSKNYMLVADTSRGDGNDFSSFHIIDILTGDQVEEYKGDIALQEFPNLIVSEAMRYNKALVVIENVGIGLSTINGVITLGYDNLYYSPKGNTTDVHKFMYLDPVMQPDKFTPGFTTSTTTRPQMLLVLKAHVHDKIIKIPSKRFNSEMSTFVWKNGKEQAQSGYNDDLIIPYAIAMYLRNTAMNYVSKSTEMSKALLMNVRNSSLLPMPSFRNDVQNPYQHDFGHGKEDISWLIR